MQRIRAAEALLPEGWARDVAVVLGSDGRIAAVGPATGGEEVRADLLLPGPANLHSHAFQRAMAGLTEARGPDPRDTFWTWRRLMYRFLDRLTPEQVEAIAAQVYLEMAEAGYAAVVEFHYLHHQPGGVPYADPAEMARRIAAAAGAVGIGLTLLPVLYTQGGCDGRALAGGQVRFGSDRDLFARILEALPAGPADWRQGVAPHSLRAVAPEELRWVAELTAGPVHVHAAEQEAEVAEVLGALGARPVEWLLGEAGADRRWCLIHATQMTRAETLALAASGAVAGLCPITEANLGDGIFDGVACLGAGGRFGVGSDSNVHVALWEELAALEYSQRLRDRSRAALARGDASTGRLLFEGAARGGAQAAGRGAGTIAVGEWGDLVAMATGNVWLLGRSGDVALDTAIFGGHGRDCVAQVWAAGRPLLDGAGRHPGRERIGAAFRRAMAELGEAIG